MSDLSMQAYHADAAIGASTAKLMLKSPQLFHDTRSGLVPREEKASFAIGTLAHMMVLEPEKFARLVTCDGPVNPATGKMYGRETLKFAAFEAENPGITVVEPWLFTMLARMPEEVRELLSGTVAEQSVFAEIDGVAVKCRPDAMRPGVIYDLKTCLDVDNLERDIAKFQYWFSAAWYRQVLHAATGKRPAYVFIFVEKRWPFRWRVATLDAGYNMHGDSVVCDVLGRISECTASNDWADKVPLHVDVSLPNWMEPELEDEDDA